MSRRPSRPESSEPSPSAIPIADAAVAKRGFINPVFFWYPNLVGYCRVISTVYAFAICFTDIQQAAFFYLLGQGLDAVDGEVARKFNQCSKFGAILDMLTDRMSTACLLIVLSHLYPQQWGLYAFLIVLDTVSHWIQMQCKLMQNKTSHKGSDNPILAFYYTKPVLLVACCGNEFYFVTKYLLATYKEGHALYPILNMVKLVTFWIFAFKQAMKFVQLYDASSEIAQIDYRDKQLEIARKNMEQAKQNPNPGDTGNY